jgi:hypothetical protein
MLSETVIVVPQEQPEQCRWSSTSVTRSIRVPAGTKYFTDTNLSGTRIRYTEGKIQ